MCISGKHIPYHSSINGRNSIFCDRPSQFRGLKAPKAHPASSEAYPASSKAFQASSKAFPAPSKALQAFSVALPGPSEARPASYKPRPSELRPSPSQLPYKPFILPWGTFEALCNSHHPLWGHCPITTKLILDSFLMKLVGLVGLEKKMYEIHRQV